MKRLVEQELLAWKNAARRKPLIIRGARQVGKSYSVEKFGRENFERIVTVDLERNRHWHSVFAGSLAARDILRQLEILANKQISPGTTLLFLDEIQSCPRALIALRYFYEECPALHVIAAGSLLEFAMSDVFFPVGRVQFLEMYPMIFAEYLRAVGKDMAAEVVLSRPHRIAESTHEMLLEELRQYLFVGGMPESVLAYANTQSLQEAFAVQRELCESYRQDFSKYAPRADPHCLDDVFRSVAQNVGQQIKYTRLADGYAHTTIKRGFDLLCNARVIKKVPSTNPSGLPLGATASGRRFKAIMADVGLWQYLCGMKVDAEYAKKDFLDIHRGAMAEQFVGQEMMVSQDSQLYYWSREARGSSAEVDYLAVVSGRIHPVEVKSGKGGRLRSMHLLLEKYPECATGLVLSSASYSELVGQKAAFIPLYFAYSATKSDGQ